MSPDSHLLSLYPTCFGINGNSTQAQALTILGFVTKCYGQKKSSSSLDLKCHQVFLFQGQPDS